MTEQKIAVTGAFGRLGRYVSAALESSAELIGIDLAPAPESFRGQAARHDILDLTALVESFRGCEAVVHLAGADASWSVSPSTTMQINVLGSWNVLEASRLAKVRKIAICSSMSAVGITADHLPRYLPIDELHPPLPCGTYGMSKRLIEEMSENFAQDQGISVICLRPSYITFPEILTYIKENVGTPREWGVGQPGDDNYKESMPVHRSYVRPEAVADSFRLALDYDGPIFSKFNITASDSYSPEPTLTHIRSIYGRLPELRVPELYRRSSYASVVDNTSAQLRLTWDPGEPWAGPRR